MITNRHIGFSACIFAVLLLAVSLLTARGAYGLEARGHTAADTGISVSGAWVRLPAVPGRPGGGYLTIQGGKTADELVEVRSPSAAQVELHSMTMDGAVMRMRQEKSIAVPADTVVSLEPGGLHLMLFDMKPGVKPGDKIRLDLQFRSGARLSTDAAARPISSPAPGKAHH